jgi:hypothetical protein
MPRNVKYNNRKTYLPNACTNGYGKYYAKAGDFVAFDETFADGSKGGCFGRIIGCIAETDNDGPDGAGKLLVCQIGSTAAFGMERWIDPSDVTLCEDPRRAAHFLAWFMQASPDSLFKYCRDDLETRKAATLRLTED